MSQRTKPGLMSGDLIDRLHEGAAAQFGSIWLEVNRLLVEQAIDTGLPTNRIDIKQMCSFSAYAVLWTCDRNATPRYLLGDLKLLDLYRESAINAIRRGDEEEATRRAINAAHFGRLALSVCKPKTSEASA